MSFSKNDAKNIKGVYIMGDDADFTIKPEHKGEVSTLLKKCRRLLKEITDDIGKGDYPSVKMSGTSISKSAAKVELTKLADFGKSFEYTAALKDSGKLKELVAELSTYLNTLELHCK
jgi:hypothetical protein